MLNRRDEWGKVHTYRYGKAYKDMKAAINLCKKLNTLFKTDKFTVVLLKQGDQIYP